MALRVQHEMEGRGDLFMDAPRSRSFEKIEEIAQNRVRWRRLVESKFGKKPRQHRTRKLPRT